MEGWYAYRGCVVHVWASHPLCNLVPLWHFEWLHEILVDLILYVIGMDLFAVHIYQLKYQMVTKVVFCFRLFLPSTYVNFL